MIKMHFGQNEKSNKCGPNFPKRMLRERMPHVPDTDTDETYQTSNLWTKSTTTELRTYSLKSKETNKHVHNRHFIVHYTT